MKRLLKTGKGFQSWIVFGISSPDLLISRILMYSHKRTFVRLQNIAYMWYVMDQILLLVLCKFLQQTFERKKNLKCVNHISFYVVISKSCKYPEYWLVVLPRMFFTCCGMKCPCKDMTNLAAMKTRLGGCICMDGMANNADKK